ncbi:amidohydrolase family protein, partial [Candidatus Micrarchaeota archaeon]|nr:amidohydrolase family protein [Candidatus Micrarchaeota archaeon]MBU1930768.1 amidohydrolase family protein [Candidatus Micrarchaeota archaeon]
KKYKNAFVVSSQAPSPEMIEASVKIAGEKKVLFGSDWPYGNPAFELTKIKLSALSSSVKKKVLGLNAKKLFKF